MATNHNGQVALATMNVDNVPSAVADAAAAPLEQQHAAANPNIPLQPADDTVDLPKTPCKRISMPYYTMGESSDNNNHPTTPTGKPGELDKFFDYSTNAVTIQARSHVPSPSSTISWSASPDFVAGFPENSKTRRKQQQVSDTSSNSENQVLKVCIEISSFRDDGEDKGSNYSTTNGSFFFVPVSLMLQREIEMQEAARVHRIGQDRWSSSRIFRMWKTHKSRKIQDEATAAHDEIMTIRLTPEVSLGQDISSSSANSSTQFRWKPWLTTCIRAYYNTGVLRIPEACQGGT